MKNKILYIAWACLYVLCVGLGTISAAAGIMTAALIVISVLFFVPGVLLVVNGYTNNDRKTILTVRWVCILSLALTTLALVALLLCAAQLSETAVNIAYDVLLLLSAPMMCSQYWIISLCLWGGLLSSTFLRKLPR